MVDSLGAVSISDLSLFNCFLLLTTSSFQCYFFLEALTSINKTNSVPLSPQANYIDWATATCRQNLVPTFVDRGVSRGQHGESPTAVNLSFLDRSHQYTLHYCNESNQILRKKCPLVLVTYISSRTSHNWTYLRVDPLLPLRRVLNITIEVDR
jgi:hypothetical protein